MDRISSVQVKKTLDLGGSMGQDKAPSPPAAVTASMSTPATNLRKPLIAVRRIVTSAPTRPGS